MYLTERGGPGVPHWRIREKFLRLRGDKCSDCGQLYITERSHCDCGKELYIEPVKKAVKPAIAEPEKALTL